MDSIFQLGIAFAVWFQGLGSWLTVPMKFFTFLGSEEFFLLFLPVIYWCVDAGLGLRLGAMLLFNSGVNDFFKLAMHGPRPYWFSTQVQALSSETSFGVPSGHAQMAVGLWGVLAAYTRRGWAWAMTTLTPAWLMASVGCISLLSCALTKKVASRASFASNSSPISMV